MKTEVLKLLKQADGYLSGQDICDWLKVSRTAVWKVINQLKEEGYEIEAVRNRGYRLMSVADVITEAELKSRMKSRWAGGQLKYYEEIDSTNNQAKRLAEEGSPHGTLVVADRQSAGKGRRGRSWVSPGGTGIWMSILMRPQIPPMHAAMMTLVMALAVCEGVERETGLKTQIKWPNDIIIDGKKICGILTEMSSELDFIHYVVTGMGINVNMEEFPDELKDKATSLRLEAGRPFARSAIIARVMESLEPYYEQFVRDEDLSGLLEPYHSRLANLGREVAVLAPGHEYQGTALGINEKGELLVKTGDGTVKQVVSGEVSVRGIYGYV